MQHNHKIIKIILFSFYLLKINDLKVIKSSNFIMLFINDLINIMFIF